VFAPIVADANLVKVTVAINSTINEQLDVENLGLTDGTYTSTFHANTFLVTPSGTVVTTNTASQSTNVLAGEAVTLTYSVNGVNSQVYTNTLAGWQVPFTLAPKQNSTIDSGSNFDCGVSASLLANSGMTITITYEYADCGCVDPDNDGDCDDQEHKHRKHHKKKKDKKK
jgi:hypothetical protein